MDLGESIDGVWKIHQWGLGRGWMKQQEETPAAQPVVEENVAFPILIGIP